jgi:hypothetical protein
MTKTFRRSPLLFAAALAAAAVFGAHAQPHKTQAAAAPTEPLRVLFVGNSLTYANDLPAMVETISRRGGDKPAIQTETLAFPDTALEDHWNARQVLSVIEKGRFQFVVLQQGPSSQPDSREHLLTWARRFDGPIRAAGARPALYMVWPAEQRGRDFPGVVASYAAAATAVNGLLLPAGSAWLAARRIDPTLELYGADRFHPSPLGSYLAALVIEAALTERAPYARGARLGSGRSLLEVESQRASVLARAATEALAKP